MLALCRYFSWLVIYDKHSSGYTINHVKNVIDGKVSFGTYFIRYRGHVHLQ